MSDVKKNQQASVLKNYLKRSKTTGAYSYRRAIPDDVRNVLGKREWNISLKTKAHSVAKAKAQRLSVQHTEDIEVARLGKGRLVRTDTAKDAEAKSFLSLLMLEGIHPDQEPRISAPKHEQDEYIKKKQQLIEHLDELRFEHFSPIDNPNDPDAKPYISEDFKLLTEQVEFLQGKSKKALQRAKPSLQRILDKYLAKMASEKSHFGAREQKAEVVRATRIMRSFVEYTGGRRLAKRYWEMPASNVTVEQAENWLEEMLYQKKPQTVGREVTTINAIFNEGIRHFKDQDRELGPESPFKGLRQRCIKQHGIRIKTGALDKGDYRAFTPKELKEFINLLPKLNDQARLIVLISMVTGCRTNDARKTEVRDLNLGGEVPSIHFRDNQFGLNSKDSTVREIPLHESVIEPLRIYLSKLENTDPKAPLFPRYVSRSADALSQLLNKQIYKISTRDKRLVAHSLRHTLQARFDSCDPPVDYRYSAAIIGWKNKDMVGSQRDYVSGMEKLQLMLNDINRAMGQEIWLTEKSNG